MVRLGNLKFAHYGAVSYMKEHCKKFGLDVQETVFPKGIDIFPAIVKGEVDIAASAADAAIANRAGGGQVYVVAGFAKGGARLVSRADLALKTVAELKGKKVGVARGGAQELLLLAELAKAGLTWSDKAGKDVQIVYLPFADLNQALLQKQIDAMCQSEPQSSQAINKGFGAEMLKPYDTPLGEPVRVLVMTEKLYREKPAVAQPRCWSASSTPPATSSRTRRWPRSSWWSRCSRGRSRADDFQDAISNSPFTYDVTVEHIQVTTDLMVKYGVGKMTAPPKAADWVKLDLLQQAKAKLGVK